ncbi:DUF4240 domain-containing protein [Paludisphaera soli]|uniref:DUF4240 domain-containing protein n=1 Tax=Paludisphaera soli TaxID=2712865 RepID=UPI0013EDCB26|nr:DUF4240 domain-containing protein [Paludisphaera soli]
MDEARFWRIIDETCGAAREDPDSWPERLTDALRDLPADEIVEWDGRFHRLLARAYTVDLWGAAYLINGGASDDGFYYFRCWLIGMGRDVYEKALAEPDSLADVVEPGVEYETETYDAARQAWLDVTGADDDDPYPVEGGESELAGVDWDYDDDEEARRRLPRLFALIEEE